MVNNGTEVVICNITDSMFGAIGIVARGPVERSSYYHIVFENCADLLLGKRIYERAEFITLKELKALKEHYAERQDAATA